MKYYLCVIAATLTRFIDACPMCKDSVSAVKDTLSAAPRNGGGNTGTGGGSIGTGFNYSIYLFLLSFFFTLGLVGFNLVRGIRSARHVAAPTK